MLHFLGTSENHSVSSSGFSTSFLIVWKGLQHVCTVLELATKCHLDVPLPVWYNRVARFLCIGHAMLYELTTRSLSDVPVMEWNNSFQIRGSDSKATQVLAAFYCLRDYLDTVINGYKEKMLNSLDIIGSYLQTFETFSVFALCMKCCFTYLNFVWMRYGVPTDHNIIPPEWLALGLWGGRIISENIHSRLTAGVKNAVHRVIWSNLWDIDSMENVKRLSLNLYSSNDSGFYHKISESVFKAEIEDYYRHYSPLIFAKCKSMEVYVEWCDEQIQRGKVLSYCFLGSASYPLARQWVIRSTLLLYKDKLVAALPRWLHRWRVPSETVSNVKILRIIYQSVGRENDSFFSSFTDAFEQAMKYSFGTMIMSKWGNVFEALSRDDYAKIFPICKALFFHYAALIKYVFNGSAVLLQRAERIVYELAASASSRTSPGLASSFALELVRDAEEAIEGTDGNPLISTICSSSLWIVCMYKQSPEDVQKAFCSIYSVLLVRRALRILSNDKKNFDDAFRREREMIIALCGIAPFDFLSRCSETISEAYYVSQKFWKKKSCFYPVVLKEFCCPLREQYSENDIPISFVDNVRNFCERFPTDFPGLHVTYSPTYSCVIVKVAKRGSLRLVLTTKQLTVLLLFNRRNRWSISTMATISRMTKEVCRSILNLFASHNIIRFVDSFNEVELLELNSLPSGTLYLSDAFLASIRDHTFSSEEMPSSSTSSRFNFQRVEAQVFKILKAEKTCTPMTVENLVRTSFTAFQVTPRDVKRALKKLIEKNFITKSNDDNTISIVP